jgi:hypothetical protein
MLMLAIGMKPTIVKDDYSSLGSNQAAVHQIHRLPLTGSIQASSAWTLAWLLRLHSNPWRIAVRGVQIVYPLPQMLQPKGFKLIQ